MINSFDPEVSFDPEFSVELWMLFYALLIIDEILIFLYYGVTLKYGRGLRGIFSNHLLIPRGFMSRATIVLVSPKSTIIIVHDYKQ